MNRRSTKQLPVEQSSLAARMTAVLELEAPTSEPDTSELSPDSSATSEATAVLDARDAPSLGRSWWHNVVDVVMDRDGSTNRRPSDEDFDALPDIDRAPDDPDVSAVAFPRTQALPYALVTDDEMIAPQNPERTVPGDGEDFKTRGGEVHDGAPSGSSGNQRGGTSAPMWGAIGALATLVGVLLAVAAFAMGQRTGSEHAPVAPAPVTNTVTSVATSVFTTTATATVTATTTAVSTPPASTVTASPPPASTVTETQIQTTTVRVPAPPAVTVTQRVPAAQTPSPAGSTSR